jgi:ATP-dependent Lhr-like helicase
MSAECWTEVYDQLAELISSHKTTLIFTNTRRHSERITRFLAERIGEESVTSHHGSLSRQRRHAAECALKEGSLKALVATASLELGIDVGEVDLVCQIGSPGSIATFLQRVGRSGHFVGGIPKGRLFPLSRDDLVQCTALLQAAHLGELDEVRAPEAPLDILAQQIVAWVAPGELREDALLESIRRAAPYRSLSLEKYNAVLLMLADGFSTSRGRRAAYLHHDQVGARLKARRGARLSAITNGGAIPDNFDYDVLLEPSEVRI